VQSSDFTRTSSESVYGRARLPVVFFDGTDEMTGRMTGNPPMTAAVFVLSYCDAFNPIVTPSTRPKGSPIGL
jgi:hypothetical protein